MLTSKPDASSTMVSFSTRGMDFVSGHRRICKAVVTPCPPDAIASTSSEDEETQSRRVSSKSSSVANTTLLLVSFPTTAFSRGGAAAAAPRPLNTAELLFTEANLAVLRCTTASTAAVVTNNKRTPTLTKNTTNASIRTHHIPHTSVSLSLTHTYIRS